MGKIRTITDLQSRLDDSFAWRLKELSHLKSAIQSDSNRETNIRSAIALSYAHWEGFIKESSIYYLEFVLSRRLTYADLKNCFQVFGISKHLETLSATKSRTKQIEAINFISKQANERPNINARQAICTKSNLNSDVFKGIMHSLGLNIEHFETKSKLIDEQLLAKRNAIAHGEYCTMDYHGCTELLKEVITLLRTYKNEIENAASQESYRL